MTRVLDLASPGGAVTLDGSTGIAAKLRMRGFGLPPVSAQWFEGAGNGARYRGGRVLARTVDLDLKVYGIDRAAVRDRLSLLGRIFAPPNQVRLTADLDGEPWYLNVVRTGGGDWDWDADTDGRTFVKTIVTVQAGDPFWISGSEQARLLEPGGLGLGLLGDDTSLSELELSSASGFGTVGFTNTGDLPAHAVWTIRAPFTAFSLTSPTGEELAWGTGGGGEPGDPKEAGFIVIDTELGTVVDETGANQYAGLGPVPRFWAIPQGSSNAGVTVNGALGGSTQIEVIWRARRWVAF